jgi:acylphosphatase
MRQKVRAHVLVSGKVQGVFFRQNTRLNAISLGVKGWIRNLDDGRVEAVFEGEEFAVKEIVEYCRIGPKYSQVEKVEVDYDDNRNEFDDFKILN